MSEPAPTMARPDGAGSGLSDQELIELIKGGDYEAFNLIVERHRGWLFHLIARIVANEHDAEEMLNDVWLKVWLKIALFESGRPLLPWLKTLATNLAIDHMRRKLRAIRAERPLRDDDSSESCDLLEKFVHDEGVEKILDALLKIDVGFRAVFLMTNLQGLTAPEVAQALKIPLGTVHSRLHAAREKLRGLLGDRDI